MEKKMETTIKGLGFRGNGKEKGNYHSIMRVYIWLR